MGGRACEGASGYGWGRGFSGSRRNAALIGSPDGGTAWVGGSEAGQSQGRSGPRTTVSVSIGGRPKGLARRLPRSPRGPLPALSWPLPHSVQRAGVDLSAPASCRLLLGRGTH